VFIVQLWVLVLMLRMTYLMYARLLIVIMRSDRQRGKGPQSNHSDRQEESD